MGIAHEAYLLHEELTAAGGAFVVRKNADDSAVCEDVDEKRLAAEGCDSVEFAANLAHRALNRRDLGNVAQSPGNAKRLRIGKLRRGEQLARHFKRTALMGRRHGRYCVASQRDNLYRQSADVCSDKRHCAGSLVDGLDYAARGFVLEFRTSWWGVAGGQGGESPAPHSLRGSPCLWIGKESPAP